MTIVSKTSISVWISFFPKKFCKIWFDWAPNYTKIVTSQHFLFLRVNKINNWILEDFSLRIKNNKGEIVFFKNNQKIKKWKLNPAHFYLNKKKRNNNKKVEIFFQWQILQKIAFVATFFLRYVVIMLQKCLWKL